MGITANRTVPVLVAAFLAFAALNVAAAQSYNEIEERVRRQMETERAQAQGDCSRVMLSWLGMRFTEEQRRRGKAVEACADAQRFALRNGVPFAEALSRVAAAHGGTRSEVCPPHTDHNPTYMLYSNCHYPKAPYIPPPPSAWDLERQREVSELGGGYAAPHPALRDARHRLLRLHCSRGRPYRQLRRPRRLGPDRRTSGCSRGTRPCRKGATDEPKVQRVSRAAAAPIRIRLGRTGKDADRPSARRSRPPVGARGRTAWSKAFGSGHGASRQAVAGCWSR